MRLFYLVLLAGLVWPQCSAAQDSTAQDSTAKNSATQHSTAQDSINAKLVPQQSLSSDQAAQTAAVEPLPAKDKTVPTAPAPADSAGARPTAGLGLGKMALSLGIVVAIVLALGWTFKKLTLRMPGSRHIKIISSMPLGPKERLLVIEMQGKQRVLGVTAHNINLLFELENSLPEEKLASDFHTQLQSFLKK